MPHYKCTACKLRLHSEGLTLEEIGELCPACGAPLELAGSDGFRSGERDDELAHGSERMIAAAIRDLGSLPQEDAAAPPPFPDESK